MTTPEQRMTVDEPVELLVSPVGSDQPDLDDQDPDDEEGS